jgi:HD superfamily phosphohydrolase
MAYHGAEHSRFGHVLGAMHTVDRALQKIEKNARILGQPLDLTEEDFKTARFAALLHDIGHQPFSHALDKIIPEEHDDFSVAITESHFASILDSAHVDVNTVVSLIKGKAPLDKPYLSSLISSQLDVDKLDYLLRDSHYAGVKYGIFDLEKILDSLCVIDKTLMVIDEGYFSAVQLIVARYNMFEQLYLHKTKRAFEGMARKVATYLIDNKKFPYPSTKEFTDRKTVEHFCGLDDNWFLKIMHKSGSKEVERIARQIEYRTPYKLQIETDDVRKKMIERKEKYDEADVVMMEIEKDIEYNIRDLNINRAEVLFDKFSTIPYKLRPYTKSGDDAIEPEIVYMFNKKVGVKEAIETRSVVVRALAEANLSTHRIYVDRAKHERMQEFLKAKHPSYFHSR